MTPSPSITDSQISEFVASPKIRNPRQKLDIGMNGLPFHSRAELPPFSNRAGFMGDQGPKLNKDGDFGATRTRNWGDIAVEGSKELCEDIIEGIADIFFDKYITMTKHIQKKYSGVFTYEAKKHMNDAVSIEVRTYLAINSEFMGI